MNKMNKMNKKYKNNKNNKRIYKKKRQNDDFFSFR